MSNQESKFDFLATRQQLGKIDGGQQKNKNYPLQPTIKFTGFLPIIFLPLSAPPYLNTNQPQYCSSTIWVFFCRVLVLISQLKNRPIGPPKLFRKVQLWRKDDITPQKHVSFEI